jgi:hypothetical protein
VHAGVALTQLDDVIVVGLAAPALTPAALGSWETVNGATTVTLCYGARTEQRGPFVSVRTSALPAQDEPTLQALHAAERDRLYDHAGIDEPDPSEVRTGIAELLIDGGQLASTMRSEDGVWAGRAELPAEPGTLVTVLARGVPPPAIRLALVSDFAPLWAARQEWIAQLAAPRDANPR